MESTALQYIKPTALTTKSLPSQVAPHPNRTPASASGWKKARFISADSKRKGKAIVVQAMESTEKAAMAEELEKELEKEGYWEWREMGKCKGCGDEGGLVELMECLEREAIMGDDEGKNPIDYNRRAQIFDKSSKIFQALKQLQLHTTSVPSS